MKLLFLVWGDPAPLRDPAVHAHLAAAGVRRLQVNVDDEPVAAALRIQTFEQPVSAVACAWTDGDGGSDAGRLAGALAAALGGRLGGRLAGWEVEERRPLDPPEAWDGSRADALANVAVLRRPDGLSREEWLDRWLTHHTPVAIQTQATFGYVQNVVVRPVTPDAPRVDAVVEELFPPEAVHDMHAFYGSGGDDEELGRRITRLMESVASIGADRDLDLVPTGRYLYRL